MLSIRALDDLPEFQPGDDLSFEILAAAQRDRHTWADRTILVIAQKVISKLEGRIVDLRTIKPSGRALQFAEDHEKDPRLVELVLQQSRRIIRMERGVIISETHHGFVCANAGIDRSNVPGEDTALLLPEDPDLSAASIRKQLVAATGIDCAVIISDSFGRPWRVGQVDVAIGVAGLTPLDDRRGSLDRQGRTLNATCIAIADELAGAAGLFMRKDEGHPVVLIEGFNSPGTAGKAVDLLRDPDQDLFR